MFLGVGVLSTYGGVFHLFTHAFFKALLFLTAGSVMHALAGQLDLRAMSGLRHKMPVTCWLMFAGCLALAGFPFTAGFYSKDEILAAALGKGIGDHGSWLFFFLALMGLFTAFLYRVLHLPPLVPRLHGTGTLRDGVMSIMAMMTATAMITAITHTNRMKMPFWPMNAPLVVLAAGALFAGGEFPWLDGAEHRTFDC